MTKNNWFLDIKDKQDAIDIIKTFGIKNLTSEIDQYRKEKPNSKYTKMYKSSKTDWDHAKICYIVYFLLWGEKYKNLYQDENKEPDFEKFRNYFGGETIFNNGKMKLGNFMILPRHKVSIPYSGSTKNSVCLNNYRKSCLQDDPFKTFQNYQYNIETRNGRKSTLNNSHLGFQELLNKYPNFFGNDWRDFCRTFFFDFKFCKKGKFEVSNINEFLSKQNEIINDFINQRTNEMVDKIQEQIK